MSVRLDLTGQKFGRLTALYPEHRGRYYGWVCACDCGTKKWVHASALRTGHTQSCGCKYNESRNTCNFKHGHAGADRNTSATYRIWASMLGRCENPRDKGYAKYGGDGIRVCPEWHDFTAFLRDMGECPSGFSLDRRDNDGDYEPSNCRWATRIEQANNTRRNYRITAFGRTQTLSEWSRESGIHKNTLNSRLKRLGWPPERALTEPVS